MIADSAKTPNGRYVCSRLKKLSSLKMESGTRLPAIAKNKAIASTVTQIKIPPIVGVPALPACILAKIGACSAERICLPSRYLYKKCVSRGVQAMAKTKAMAENPRILMIKNGSIILNLKFKNQNVK